MSSDNDLSFFKDSNYCVKIYAKNNTSPIIIAFSNRDERYVTKKDFEREFGKNAILGIGFNYISFVTNENCWYQNDSKAAISFINDFLKSYKGQVVTYGCSMGGFAAINFAQDLNATFLSFSPQASLDVDFMNSINDKRWATEANRLAPFKSNMLSGNTQDAQGIVIYDGEHIDKKHIDALMCKTSGTFINLRYSGHGSVSGLNSTYSLKKLINELYIEKLSFKNIEVKILDKWEDSIEFLSLTSYDEFERVLVENNYALSRIALRNVIIGLSSGFYSEKIIFHIPKIIEANLSVGSALLDKLKSYV
jgi:hypothetical protein